MNRGAIVLCGGHSRRMGRDKATLPFGSECMLQRVVRILACVVDARNIVVVAANGQTVPPLREDVLITRDGRDDRGPLEGLAAGWRALPAEIDAVYATSCDVPLLVPAFVERMFGELDATSIAVPIEDERLHPLAAAYRREVLSPIERLLAADQLRVRLLFSEVPTRTIPVEILRDADPELDSLQNLNRPEDYEAALRRAGLFPEG